MYNINLIGKNIVTLDKNLKIVKYLKLFSLFLTFAIFGLIVLSVMAFFEKDAEFKKIEKLKMNIDEERRLNKIKDVESEWEANYYKMLAVQDVIKNNTKTGSLLRDVGLYMPEGYKILRFELNEDKIIKGLISIIGLDSDKFRPKPYEEIMQNSYNRSELIGEPFQMSDKMSSISVKGRNVDAVGMIVPLKGVVLNKVGGKGKQKK
ncbi:MAG: hypothetical protein LBR69_00905 [Endomicrobium sp.]|jgi:hypothetical protein|nr:hypothetical protein [Endomicrobium sp.]